MNLRDLQYAVAVADHRHFGKAAEASHVSQPTLSMQLRKLEETLGVQLFERNNKQVMVTKAGEAVILRARDVLREAEALRAVARASRDPLAGDLRLGLFPTLAPYLLPQVIPVLHARLPLLRLLLVEEKTEKLLDGLKRGTLDAALLALPVSEEGLEATPLFDDAFLLAVPKGHPLAKRKKIYSRDIARESLLLLDEGHCLRSQALEVCSMSGASERADFRATSLETLRQMVSAGVGITLIPQMAVTQDDNIAYIPFAAPAPSRRIGLVFRKGTARRVCIDEVAGIIDPLFSL